MLTQAIRPPLSQSYARSAERSSPVGRLPERAEGERVPRSLLRCTADPVSRDCSGETAGARPGSWVRHRTGKPPRASTIRLVPTGEPLSHRWAKCPGAPPAMLAQHRTVRMQPGNIRRRLPPGLEEDTTNSWPPPLGCPQQARRTRLRKPGRLNAARPSTSDRAQRLGGRRSGVRGRDERQDAVSGGGGQVPRRAREGMAGRRSPW